MVGPKLHRQGEIVIEFLTAVTFENISKILRLSTKIFHA